MITRIILFISLLVIGFLCGRATAFAATPLTLQLNGCEAFRHLVQTNDWLFVCRAYTVPTSEHNFIDNFSVVVTAGAFEDVIVLENKVHLLNRQLGDSNERDYIVTETGTPTDLTSFCVLSKDAQTINCTGTGLADGPYDVQVRYRSGWNAYSPSDAILRLRDGTTVVRQAPLQSVGYQLGVVYLSASQVAASGMTWGDTAINLQLQGSPLLWENPFDDVASLITWQTTASPEETKDVLAGRLPVMLKRIEQDAELVAGTLVNPTNNKITNTGQAKVNTAWPFFSFVVPLAFEQGTKSVGQERDRGAGDTSFFQGVVGEAQSKNLYKAVESLGNNFGVSPYVAGFFLSLILSLAGVMGVIMLGAGIGASGTAIGVLAAMVPFLVFWGGVLGGYVHWVVPGIPTGIMGGLGVAKIFGGMIFGRG